MSYCPDCAVNGIITKLDATTFCTTCQAEMILGSPLDLLATALLPIVERAVVALERLADCAEITIRWEQDTQAKKLSLKDFLKVLRQIVTPKDGDGA